MLGIFSGKARTITGVPAPGDWPLVRLDQVTRVYATGAVEVVALGGVSLELERGELVAIVGASGSGKSTLMNLLGTLDRPSSGRYLLDGEAVEGCDDAELAAIRNSKLGFVFQSFNLLPRETALDNVELPLVYARVPRRRRRERALEALERVGLGDRVDHLPTELSGDQQQRVAIARAIVNQPVMLLADEPTGALDSRTAREILALFHLLHQGGMTIVIVTHDPAVAAEAERVVTVCDGVIAGDERAREPRSGKYTMPAQPNLARGLGEVSHEGA
jgi:putative ABC transport system ATP-binding protein